MKNYIPKTFRQILAMLLCVAMVLPMAAVPGYATEVTEPTVSVIAETQPETTVPETTAPEATVPETTVPETTAPEATVPETTVPETTAPEATVPETTVPETTAPEATVPETTESEESVPETTAPEVSEERPMMMMMSSGNRPLAVVYAASDFQPYNSSGDYVDGGKNVMNLIVGQMYNDGYTAVGGALICGDYSKTHNTWGEEGVSNNNKGRKAVAEVLGNTEMWGLSDAQVVYIQGNHDPANTSGLDPFGKNDTDKYGVFAIHEDNFPWEQGKTANAEATVRETADDLEEYLQEKVNAKDSRPIFVLSHVPLHYGYRTTSAKDGDNIYAKYIFDVLNEYGKQLNIIFLFGHNHSSTYDDYLGGGAVYLAKNDDILIPDAGKTDSFESYNLNFTYMNAGYLGYYNGSCATGLSSTIFTIYDNEVVVARYSANTKTASSSDNLSAKESDLKVEGVWDSKHTNNTSGFTSSKNNKEVYSSTQSITLMQPFTEELKSEAVSAGILTKGNSGDVYVAGVYGKSYTVEWGTSDASIAEVTASESDPMAATVTAKKSGNVKITAQIREGLPTRAVGDTKTLTMDLEVVDVEMVTLAEGEQTFFVLDNNQDSSSWTADTSKRYVLVSQDKGNPTAGKFMAMYYTGELDSAEGDDIGSNGYAWQELNAEPITVMELPINGQKVYAVSTEDDSFLWKFRESGGLYHIDSEHVASGSIRSLMLSKGHTDAAGFDLDDDGIRMRGQATTVQNHSNWRMSNRGAGLTAYCDDMGSTNLYYAPYYDSIQGDISVYYTQNGGENMGKRIYLYEESTVNLTEPIFAYMKDTSGSVSKGVGMDAGTGDVIYIQNGGKTVTVPVTLNMLSGDNLNIAEAGTYSDLTVTYAGKPITTNYTLKVNEATTLLKNEGGKFRSTIYRQTEEMVGGRHYLIVDAAEAGEAHAMGAEDTSVGNYTEDDSAVSAHNVLIQSFKVGGQTGLYIDSTRYSDDPDNPTQYIVEDQGNVNADIFSDEHKAATRLVWTPTKAVTYVPPNPNEAVTGIVTTNLEDSYWFLTSEYRNGRLYGRGGSKDNNNRYDLRLVKSGDADRDEWKYNSTGSVAQKLEGVVLNPGAWDNYRLFYNAENYNGDITQPGYTGDTTKEVLPVLDKNFIVEGETKDSTNIVRNPLTRRTWLYEQVDNIDTITARLSNSSGSVTEDKNASSATGTYILVETFFTDGTMEQVKVPVRASMLSGTYDLNTPESYSNLTVTYQGKVISQNYTLKVNKAVENDKPEFPNEGAVKIDKQLDTTKYAYLDTGAASIDLSVTGIPAQSGVDIVFVLDTSSSMERCIHHKKLQQDCETCGKVTVEKSRLTLLKQTLIQTMKDLQEPIDGYAPDIDVAVACFNGQTPINTDIMLDRSKKNTGDANCTDPEDATQVSRLRMDSSTISLNFTDISKLTETGMQAAADGLYLNPGTNYDRGMEIAYNLLKAKQEQDALNGEIRQQILVFMSDGIPFQFNYTHGTPWMIDWDNYLQGSAVTAVPADTDALTLYNKYYHSGSTLWMAEAIKGNPNQKYKIINPDLQESNDKIEYINGLGATIYTVGMGITADNRVSADAANKVLEKIASPVTGTQKHFYSCTHPEDFTGAFSEISTTIRKAGNAAFTDQMGPEFDLITSNKVNDGKITLNPAPSIIVKQYELYKRSEIGQTLAFENEDGTTTSVKVTEKMVGTRKPVAPAVIETVTFNDDGSAAYSDKRDINGDGVCNHADNILENDGKVIHAATFWYNKDIQNAQKITVNGKEIDLERECFYWNVGDIPQDELVLSYDVYLTGSMEGNRNAGTYNTNAHAELNYTNYLNNPCELKVPTPKLPWNKATVGYGFYLVNAHGDPIINQDTGETGSFEQSIKLTQPVYKDFNLNSDGVNVIAEQIAAGNVLPEGYTLYDNGATYSVSLNSDGSGQYTIVATTADGKQTTYVVGVSDTAITGGTINGQTTNTVDFATANTIVWFGVVANVQCVPDTVVIDFGLPVDINVLANDTMMGNNGKVQYVGETDVFATGYAAAKEAAKQAAEEAEKEYVEMKMWEYLQTIKGDQEADVAAETLEGTYGKLEVLKNEKAETTGELRYTLNDAKAVADAAEKGETIINGMQMKEEETFVYAVNYTGDVGVKGYYYSTVTVIPATTIYYEDSFVSFKVKNYEDAAVLTDAKYKDLQWQPATTNTSNATQAEDRPGEFSLSDLDANNIYGYDAAYKNMTQYSLGNAMKVTVGKQSYNEKDTTGKETTKEITTYGTAEFTFWGTGFDVISLTSAKTGTIVVKVNGQDLAGNTVKKNYIVDTYYGYKYEDGKWVVDTSATENNALYQIPVMKVEDLPYGKYNVTISASHKDLYDHSQYETNDKYDFYLDAIRIYDPANDGANSDVIKDAYVADGEGWPEYFELRDLLISSNDFDALEEDQQTSGIVFIDNTKEPAGKSYTVTDYKNYGPNNELYLAPGQAVVFNLDVPAEKLANIHLALKGVGKNVQAKVHNARVETSKVPYSKVGTATDLYYDITQLNGKTVIISNSEGSEGILSITNIKVTYKTAPSSNQGEIEDSFFTTTRKGVKLALLSLRAPVVEKPEETVPETTAPEETVPETTVPETTVPEETVPETTIPEETVPETTVPETTAPAEPEVPETFEPQKFNVQLSASSVKVGSNVIVTVTTGTDVDHITVNSEEVSRYTANRWAKTRTWQVKVKAETAGAQAVEVICYNAEDLASAPVVKTVTVTQQYTSVTNWLTDVVTGIVSSLLSKWR